MANKQCWFCGQETSMHEHAIRLNFEKTNYADRVAQARGESPDRLRKTLIVGRCDSCASAHKKYSRISLFAILPAAVMAYSLFLLFEKANPNLVFIVMAVAMIGFGVVLWFRRQYLKKRGVKALVELEMKNDDIRETLASGWYRT